MMRSLTEFAKWGGVWLVALSGLILYLFVLFAPDQFSVSVLPYAMLIAMGVVLAIFGYYLAPKYETAARNWRPQPRKPPPERTLSSLMTVSMAAAQTATNDVASATKNPSESQQ